MTKENTILTLKDRRKGAMSSLYKSIRSLIIPRKIITAYIREEILYAVYYFLKNKEDDSGVQEEQMIYSI